MKSLKEIYEALPDDIKEMPVFDEDNVEYWIDAIEVKGSKVFFKCKSDEKEYFGYIADNVGIELDEVQDFIESEEGEWY